MNRDGELFLTLQRIDDPIEAQRLMALQTKPIAYVDVPLDRIPRSFSRVGQVEEQFGQVGGGIEAVLTQEVNISGLKIVELVS